MIDVKELRKRIDGMYAPPFSERGQEVIHDGRSHVSEVWEDGEITTTKAGDLYQARRIHGSHPPILPEGRVLFPFELVDDHDEYQALKRRESHMRMVIVDDELKDILAEYRELTIDEKLFEHLRETGYYEESEGE